MVMDEDKVIETASESYESEIDYTERKPRNRERGPDKKPRTYRANSMSNFVQFKDRPEEFATYLKDVKGVDVTGNSGIIRMLLILGGIGLAGLGSWWLYNHYKNGKNDNIENKHTSVGKAV
jgi:hypothetical protein